ncbi:MAG: GAF domain-containing protein [Bauldia sp.]|nr:GAF domain-containing protein [Bauldia sp.]
MTVATAADAPGRDLAAMPAARPRGGLFRKYVLFFGAVISTALVGSGALEIWFGYREQMESLEDIQRIQADAAAYKIEQFAVSIQDQLGWTVQLPWPTTVTAMRPWAGVRAAVRASPFFTAAGMNRLVAGLAARAVAIARRQEIQAHRFDAVRLLGRVEAITELSLVDPDGFEQFRVSTLAMEVIGSRRDLSGEPKFREAIDSGAYFGPVYYRRESEPYMTIAVGGLRRVNGVAIAEVNLKFIFDLIAGVEVGESGIAYVVDPTGRLVAHPETSLVLRNLDLSALPQVRAAIDGATPPEDARDLDGNAVVTTYATIPQLGWLVFVELPISEALAPVYLSLARTGGLLLLGLIVAGAAGVLLARRMVGPISRLQTGAAVIGRGDLTHRIDVRTGDELEALADEFNDMAGRLEESRVGLERRVSERTRDLARSVEELVALGEVSQALNSTLDVEAVLTTIVAKAVQLSSARAGGVHELDEVSGTFRLIASFGSTDELTRDINALRIRRGETAIGIATLERRPTQIADLETLPPSPVRDVLIRGGFRSLLALPLLRGDRVLGALVVRREAAGAFSDETVRLLETLASQSAIAIRNAQLFADLAEQGRQLSLASAHKSQFLANMSHELRTPLNAILGFAELMLDDIYGPLSPRTRQVVERLQANGVHLLGLINDVLDLSKIEAGQLTLTLGDYDLASVVRSVASATEPLARARQLELRVVLPERLPPGRGDERRLRQVLLNLVGNAIKFTDAGFVEIAVRQQGGRFEIDVADSGPGVAEADRERIFLEFQQGGSARGGTGLGLAISQRIVALHGGSIRLLARDAGAAFRVDVPILVAAELADA